jgi:outer membrane protein assembly factor BamB
MGRSRALVTAATTLAVVLWSWGGGQPSRAAAPPELVTHPRAAHPTARVLASGRGFLPDESVGLSFDSTQVAAVVASDDGSFSATFAIPKDALPGEHEVRARGLVSGQRAAAPFLVRTNWSQGAFDAAHTVHNRYENALNPSNVGRLRPAWRASVSGGFHATPIVANGRVYVGGGDGRMHAFDEATGVELWTGPKETILFVDSATFAHGLVYASALYQPLRAYDAETGDVVWTAPVCGQLRAPPTVVRNVLFMACFDGTLYALDSQTGAMLWSAPGGCCVFDQAPVVENGSVFQIRTDHSLTAYQASTGTALWTTQAFAVGTMAAAYGRLFYGNYPDVIALDQSTGEEQWRAPVFSFEATGSPAVADGLVFAETGELFALDANTGDVVWTAPAASAWGPSVANGVIYASNQSGEWDAYDETDGSLLWSVTVGHGCGGSCAEAIPVVANGTLYLTGPDQYLRAYRIGP